MCFSPEADFTGGTAIVGIGVVALTQVRARREWIVGALPLLFGLHQLDEGFVWLGLQGHVSTALGDTAKQIYILFAHVFLPIVVPIGFLMIETERRRRRMMVQLAMLGVVLGLYLLRQVTVYPIGAQEEAHCIDYVTHTPNSILIGLIYVVATCGPALLSSRRHLRRFGLISAIGAVAVAIVRVDELTSLWCVYVALVSVLILVHLRREHAGIPDAAALSP